MRIIAGKYKGRRLNLPREAEPFVRPTSDFAREAIFNILAHGRSGLNGHTFEGKYVLDAFCGTGALGLEALSRGAAHVTFVDNARAAIAAARDNARHLGAEAADYLFADAAKLSAAPRRYDLIFLDPPYFTNLLAQTLLNLRHGGWLAEEALIVVEYDAKERLELPHSFQSADTRRYGRATIEVIKPMAEKITV